MSQEAIARARELAHPFTLAAALMLSDWLTLLRGDGQPIADESEAVALMTEHGFAFFLAMQGVLCGARLTAAGKAEEAVAAIRQGIEAAGATGAAQQFPFFQGALANAYRKAGRIEESLALLDKALDEVRKANEHFSDAELHRSKGEVLQMQGRTAAAEACFRTAIEIARGQGARSLELRASIDLARLLDGQGKRDEARAILAEIYGWFTEGFDTLDLKEARALLDRLQ